MHKFSKAIVPIAALSFFAGCGDSGPGEITKLSDCNGRETNVQPTYLESQSGYSAYTDPAVLDQYQRTDVRFNPDYVGIGTMVCKVDVGEAIFFSHRTAEQMQVLTQRAVEVSKAMQTDAVG